MRKHFVLSKRTVISKREVTKSFGSDNTVIIPMAVLDEISEISKTYADERSKLAREILEYLWSLDRKALFGDGVIQENGSILKVSTNYLKETIPDKVSVTRLTETERRILSTCLGIKKKIPSNEKVVLISKNPLLRMKAELIGIEAETFKDELLLEVREQYTGRCEIEVSKDCFEEFTKNGEVQISTLNSDERFYQNMFVLLKCGQDAERARVSRDEIVKLVFDDTYPYGIIPKNNGQRFMKESLLMDSKVAPLVIIKGPAGTAKTLMSLATGLYHVDNGEFNNGILISRSPTETGEKIGYLPGSEQEKIDPFMRGVMDNLKVILSTGSYTSTKSKKRTYESKSGWTEKPEKEDGTYFFEKGVIKAEAIGFIRGRSICDSFIIIDEAQNLTPTEVKTIITRVAIGTKLVLLGDPEQIDRPGLNERNNGLSYASERFKGNESCWQITMKDEESVRSNLARVASILL